MSPAGERISERSAPEVESHRLFEGEADGREVSYAWTNLNVGERRAQRLAVPEDTGGQEGSMRTNTQDNSSQLRQPCLLLKSRSIRGTQFKR